MTAQGKKVSIDSVKETLKPLFDSYNIKKAILFGSTAKGTNTENSDIDLVVDGNLRGFKFFGFLEEVTKLLDNEIDLIEQSQIIKGSRIDEEINKYGVVIYGQ